MKKITYIIQDCAHCNLIDFDGTRYFCTHPKMKRIAVIPMVKDAIHSDCPLEDDLPESKGSDSTKELLNDIISWELDLGQYPSLETILREHFIIIKRNPGMVIPKPELSKSDGWIPVTQRLPEVGERVLCDTQFGVQIGFRRLDGLWSLSNGAVVDVKLWQPLPAVPKGRPVEKPRPPFKDAMGQILYK